MAVLLILVGHLTSYLEIAVPSSVVTYLQLLGLGTFTFLSGFLVFSRNPICSYHDFLRFYKKRIVRIYPLYLVAVAIFYCFFWINPQDITPAISTQWLIVNILGLQLVFLQTANPPYVNFSILWYIGLLLMLYFTYPFIAYFSKRMPVFAISTLIFLVFIMLRVLFDIIEIRFFAFYFVFVSGLLLCKYHNGAVYQRRNQLLFAIAATAFAASIILHASFHSYYISEQALASPVMASGLLVVLNVIMISFGILMLYLASFMSRYLGPAIKKVFFMCAIGSYAVYLFQVPFLQIYQGLLKNLNIHGASFDILFCSTSVLVLFPFGYWLQTSADRITARLLAYF